MILTPDKLWTRAEVLSKPCPVPREGGVYGWYFDAVPPGIVAANHHTVGKASLLYVGISPKAPPKNGARPSKQTMRERIQFSLIKRVLDDEIAAQVKQIIFHFGWHDCSLGLRFGLAIRPGGAAGSVSEMGKYGLCRGIEQAPIDRSGYTSL